MSKKYISEIIGQEYLEWNTGDVVFINAGTGKGKSHFIKNVLNKHCKENGKRILLLTNREILKNQIKKEMGLTTIVTVLNYQKVESMILSKNISFYNYDYIVMDECHYFFADSTFNIKTDVFWKVMLSIKLVCKVFMTATPTILMKYFEKNDIKVDYKYELKTDYSYISKVTAFNTYETIDSIIESIPQDEQILLFSSAKRAYDISKKHGGAFICSKYNKDGYYKKYVQETENEKERDNIIKNEEFKKHLLCCTIALDNGINIKEGTPVKHIIIDIFDRDEFIQCLGRKRVGEGEEINLYFYSYKNDNKRINGFRRKIINSLERADYLSTYGEQKYVEHKFKNEQFTDTKIIDDVPGEDGSIYKSVNECMYEKYSSDLAIYNSILSKKKPITYKSIIALRLGVNEDSIIEFESTIMRLTLEETLKSIVGKRLYREQQNELIEFIGLKDARGRLQKSISQLNLYLKENKMLYIIDVPKRKSYRNDNGKVRKEKSYWMVGKIAYDMLDTYTS